MKVGIIIRDVPAAVCQNCGEYYWTRRWRANCTARAEKRCSDIPRWKSSAMRR